MKARAVEIHHLSPAIAVCQTFDANVKADLYATCLTVGAGAFLIDPFSISDETLSELAGGRDIVGVIVTNENHLRASADIACRFGVPIYAHPLAEVRDSRNADDFRDIEPIPIPGAPNGEIALYSAADGGTLVIGDALINFGSNGFAFLPAKYCTNGKRMRESLRQLLRFDFSRMLFAHGAPITTNARDRLAALLESDL